ncbi:branched-chain amino acid ABC transporter ATP-binding protein/permease [soil metagenome]
MNSYYVYVLATIAMLATVGIGLNLLLGLAGQVSFGHVGFYSIGAYVVAILTTKAGWSFWFAWPVATALAGLACVALALPALRVRGPYLAMITIAFAFIVENVIIESRSLTGGQSGIMGIAAPHIGSLKTEPSIALLAIALTAAALWIFTRISRGPWGAAMRAVRDGETAAESIGIDPLVVKTVAFALSAAFAGAAGALFAPLSGFVTPQTFGFLQSILFVLVVMIGGSGSITGPLIGALIVGLLPEWLSRLEDYRLLVFGVMLLVVLWAAPGGVVGAVAAARQRWVARKNVAAESSTGVGDPVSSGPFDALAAGLRRDLEARGLTMQFGGVRAVNALDFEAVAGQVTALIGPNGAGKSTVLNLLSGFYRPSAGGFTLGGQTLVGRAANRIARQGVARSYQTSQLFGSLTVEQNVALGMRRGRLGALLGVDGMNAVEVRAHCRTLLGYCGYRGAVDARACDLPHVDRRLVEIARALAAQPSVLLLDEPAAGLAQDDKAQLGELLRRIAARGVAVVLVEHDMALVMSVSDRIVVLESGQFLAAGTPRDIQADAGVRRAYLGEDSSTIEPRRRRDAVVGAIEPIEQLGVNGLVAGYGAEPVIKGIDLQFRRGEMVALLGANGAGKSTLMRAMAGLHRPVQGGIHLDGREISTLAAERIVGLGLVLVPEGRQVFAELSVLDNIRLGSYLDTQAREARVEQMLVRFPRLRERLHQRAGLLSGGEQQMLAIARALMARPRVLLLDEPSLGLAPKIVEELFAALDELRAESMTLVLVDQMAGLALALADRAYVIEAGRIVASGDAANIAADGALAASYLGVAA